MIRANLLRRLCFKSVIQKNKSRGYVLLVIPVCAFGLGVWQVRRRRWKLDLIEQLNLRLKENAIELKNLDTSNFNLPEYTVVKMKGVFEQDRNIYVGPRSLISDNVPKDFLSTVTNTSMGYNVITPMRLSNGSQTVLVNRGWISKSKIKDGLIEFPQLNTIVEIEGLVRKSEKQSMFIPSRSISQSNDVVFSCKDVSAIASELKTTDFLVDMKFDEKMAQMGAPIGGQTRLDIRNEHIQYIITWFSLAVFSMVMWLKMFPK